VVKLQRLLALVGKHIKAGTQQQQVGNHYHKKVLVWELE
jgi:hypothetical protein